MGKQRRWRSALQGGAEEAVDQEIVHHIDELTDRLMAAGASADAARLEAEARFGDMKRIRDDMVKEARAKERRMQLGELASSILWDLRYAVRGLRRNPVFAATVIITVSLGLGAAAAVFAVLDALLLRPLPYTEPDRLVTLGHKLENGSLPFLYGDQLDRWREAASPHELALYQVETAVRTDGAEAANVAMVVTGHEIDEMLGVRPAIGRGFAAEDAIPGVNRMNADMVVLAAHGEIDGYSGQHDRAGRTAVRGGRRSAAGLQVPGRIACGAVGGDGVGPHGGGS